MDLVLIKKNFISTLLLQIVTMICNFIIPQFTIRYFGSATNGLVSSISQFLNVISLVEGGASSVVLANLYRPLKENDHIQISRVVKASKCFFKRLSFAFIVLTLVIGFVYPILKKVPFSYEYTFALIITIGLTTFIQYTFALSYRLLLRASQKVYIVSFIQILFLLINTALVVFFTVRVKDVLLVKVVGVVAYCIQPVLFTVFVNKYFDIDKNIEADQSVLKQRWDSFGQNLAYYIHANTDVLILTIFSSFTEISVYSVYTGIIGGVKGVSLSVSNSFGPTMGNVLLSDDENARKETFMAYENVNWIVTSILFGTTISMIESFVRVYTLGINDVNYSRFAFAVIITSAEAIYTLRDPYISVIYSSGHFKETKHSAYIESAINILISLTLVRNFGLIGVGIGTLAGMTYRAIYSMLYVNAKLVKHISGFSTRIFVSFVFIMICNVFISRYIISLGINTYVYWMLAGVCAFVFNILLTLGISVFLFRKSTSRIIKGLIIRKK